MTQEIYAVQESLIVQKLQKVGFAVKVPVTFINAKEGYVKIAHFVFKIEAALQVGKKSGCTECLPSCAEVEYFSEISYTNIHKGLNIWVDEDNLTASW